MNQAPYIGAIVVYKIGDLAPYPAIIVKTTGDIEKPVDLRVFGRGAEVPFGDFLMGLAQRWLN